jgi:tetratricopeptide (TPR) repeat protein
MKHPLRHSLLGAALAVALATGTAGADVLDDLRSADAEFDEGDYDKAARLYDKAIRVGSCAEVSPQTYSKRAAIFIIQKQYEQGLLFVAQRAEQCHPDAPEVLEQKALMLWALGSKPDAVNIAEKVVASNPGTFSLQLILSEFYYPREPKKVIKATEAYLSSRPAELEGGDVLPRLRLGLGYLQTAYQGEVESGERTDEVKKLYQSARDEFELVLKKHRRRPFAEVNANNGLCAVYTVLEEYSRAITVCEKITQNPRNIDRRGAVWFNLGQAYLGLNQAERARAAGNEFIRMRRAEPKGHKLVGDAFFAQRNFERALEKYNEAEKLAQNQPALAARISIDMGKTYRQLGRTKEALEKLEQALERNPDDMELIAEVGSAYIDAREDAKALATVEKRISGKAYDELREHEKVGLQLIAARASYNQGKHEQALGHYRAAHEIRPDDVKVRIGMVQTINYQAYQAFNPPQGSNGKRSLDQAETLLQEALKVHPGDNLTNQNMAVIALERSQCDQARKHLQALAKARSYQLAYHRLMARSYMCEKKPDTGKAAEHYAAAEKQAADAKANLVQAEIYTEWAPLIWDKNLDDAIDKLETAVQFSIQNPAIANAAQRNLSLAMFRRGMLRMAKGDTKSAVSDLEVATRNPQLLQGSEPLAFDMALALAYLGEGNTGQAEKLLDVLAKKGSTSSYLKAPYDKVGPALFSAYAKYRAGGANRRAAADEFAKLTRSAGGKLEAKLKDLAASAYHYAAFDDYRRGKNAAGDLKNAGRYAVSNYIKRDIDHNQAVLSIGKGKPSGALVKSFERMGESPPEALANLGILYDRQGKTKDAYDTWVKARAKGVRSSDLNEWIDAKKRIFGY